MPQFNIRVYGLLVTEQKQVLVSDEIIKGKPYTKFPGGGLEYGEGTRDCLVREFMEEVNLRVEVADHLYTTDFFQVSAFHKDHQIISIYYTVKALEPFSIPLSDTPFCYDYKLTDGDDQLGCFRLVAWEDFSEQVVDLPIDKIAARMLKERY